MLYFVYLFPSGALSDVTLTLRSQKKKQVLTSGNLAEH